MAWRDGEANDHESGLHHLAHALANVVFVMWAENELLREADDWDGPMQERWNTPPE